MKHTKFVYIICLLLVLITSCKKDEELHPVDSNGLSKEITDFVPQDILDKMKSMGFPINGGNHPPDIQNSYIASPFVLDSSLIAGEGSGWQIADYHVKFYNQDNTNLSVLSDYENGIETGTGVGSFIVGDGNMFTVFIRLDVDAAGSKATAVSVISGEKADNGILNLYNASFVVDIISDPNGYFIPEGKGRIFYDQDGFSEVE